MAALRKKSIAEIPVAGRRVLVRVDFNVPMNAGEITDDLRIRAGLKTINHLLAGGATVILMSHLGRPGGRPDPALSMRPVGERLSGITGKPVRLLDECVGTEVEAAVIAGKPGEIFLLENLRFHPEEEKNDPDFSRSLARLGDLYVNDAFGAAHRAHASTVGVAGHLPAYSGFLMADEISALSQVLEDPIRPLVAVIGGAKITSNIGVIQNLLSVVDRILIGGGIANTFLKAQGIAIEKSFVEDDQLGTAQTILERAGGRLTLPVDARVAEEARAGAAFKDVGVDEVPADWMILDIGPETVAEFAGIAGSAGTVVWNGPVGLSEIPAFAHGTLALANHLAGSEARVIVGGGDLVGALKDSGTIDKLYHVSTGGGASLEFLEGRELPGVAALEDA